MCVCMSVWGALCMCVVCACVCVWQCGVLSLSTCVRESVWQCGGMSHSKIIGDNGTQLHTRHTRYDNSLFKEYDNG